ncbi:Bax inhibitor-1 family protein [Acidithiobacillus sp.]|uniref:Bax inhibitor-1/YccA family protein n=1 Tax=Acidithiobacillus sp. TaxID=1872118 RepID=UPI0026092D4C|nr:Bax inhibitor-1 family protein [Acidithiobacillus sp.]
MNQDQNPYQFPDSMSPSGSGSGTAIGTLMGKTYALLAATLVVSTIASIYGMHSPFAYEHPFILMIGSFALLFAVQYTGAHRSPFAVPLVFLFAGGMGMMMGPAIEMYLRMPGGASIIAEALGTTAAMFVGLSAYAVTTRRDFSNIGGFLITGLVLAIVVSLLNIFLLHIPALQLAIAGVLVLVFSGLILFDTQRMIRGGIQEPVLLVVGLYLDIINLFMALLEIFGGNRN